VTLKTYSVPFKRKIVQRLLAPGAPSATALSKEVDIPQSTLSRWVRRFGRVGVVSNDNEGAASRPRRPEDWNAEERLRAVTEAGRLEGKKLAKKEKALDAANAIVTLQKKVHALLEDADDDTEPSTGD